MKQEQVIEGNKLIAEFMHSKGEEGGYWWYAGNPTENEVKIMYTEYSAKYHTSWDWLMPVVKKIESIKVPQIAYGFELNMLGNRCVTIANVSTGKDVVVVGIADYNENIFHTKIEAVWLVVVEFIKWYNANK